MVKAEPDLQRIKELLERLSDNQNAFNLAVVDLVREFLGTLRPEQIEVLLSMVRGRNIFRYFMNAG